MNNIHGARINMDVLERKGSGYVAHHGADFINFHDKASQIVDIREGPDGTLWMIDWYDLNQCHRPQREAHDYTTGRIFRLGKKGQIVKAADFGKMDLPSLIKLSFAGDEWESRHALRVIRERNIPAQEFKKTARSLPPLEKDANGNYPNREAARSRFFRIGGEFDPDGAINPSNLDYVGAPEDLCHLISFVSQRPKDRGLWLAKFADFAKKDEAPIVRLALASACQRLTVEQRKSIVLALLAHEEDKDDPNLPLMDWYAAEPIVAADPAWAAEALAACKIPKVAEFIARRLSEK
jgi:hypothetical protein